MWLSTSNSNVKIKIKYIVNTISSLKNSADAKACWAAINSFKIKSERRVGKIKANEWLEHFRALLNLLASSISFAEPFITLNEILDSEFTYEDITSVLVGLKNNKTPGFDRLSYEFFKYATKPTVD